MKNVMTKPSSKAQVNKADSVDTLNSTKIANPEVEDHPFKPVLPPNATVMMMGSFPPTSDKWAMRFHYPNFYNDMWRIYGGVFFDDIDYFRSVLREIKGKL